MESADGPDVGELDVPLLLLYGSGFYTVLLVALHPLTVLKTRMQAATTPMSYREAVAQVHAAAGRRGFFAGLTPSIIGALPARSVYIAALEAVRPRARAVCEAAGADRVTSASVSNAAAGFAAVLAAQLTYCPTDVVTQRLMVADPAKGETAASVFRSIVASGWTGLYRGLGVSLVTHLPGGSVWWGAYGGARALVARQPETARLPALVEQTLAAVWAAFCTVSLTSPLDVIKTRTQLATGAAPPPLLHTTAELLREHGVRGLYRGFLPRWAHASLWGGTVIALYEELKLVCTKKPRRKQM
jgi:solute carrier family 25 protein 44